MREPNENSDSARRALRSVQEHTTSLNGSLTVNTDFAETEADARQINLTRFPLFFPEKRAFFLEGAGVFDVAGLAGNNDLVPFFTRRIGLLSGEEVPIAVGTKVVGRQGHYNIGIVECRHAISSEPAYGPEPVARASSRNPPRQSWVGGIVTHGSGRTGDTARRRGRALCDLTFRGGKNLARSVRARTQRRGNGARRLRPGFRSIPQDDGESPSPGPDRETPYPASGFGPRRDQKPPVSAWLRPLRWGIASFSSSGREYIRTSRTAWITG